MKGILKNLNKIKQTFESKLTIEDFNNYENVKCVTNGTFYIGNKGIVLSENINGAKYISLIRQPKSSNKELFNIIKSNPDKLFYIKINHDKTLYIENDSIQFYSLPYSEINSINTSDKTIINAPEPTIYEPKRCNNYKITIEGLDVPEMVFESIELLEYETHITIRDIIGNSFVSRIKSADPEKELKIVLEILDPTGVTIEKWENNQLLPDSFIFKHMAFSYENDDIQRYKVNILKPMKFIF